MAGILSVSALTDEEVKLIEGMAKAEDRSVSYILARLIRLGLRGAPTPIA